MAVASGVEAILASGSAGRQGEGMVFWRGCDGGGRGTPPPGKLSTVSNITRHGPGDREKRGSGSSYRFNTTLGACVCVCTCVCTLPGPRVCASVRVPLNSLRVNVKYQHTLRAPYNTRARIQ